MKTTSLFATSVLFLLLQPLAAQASYEVVCESHGGYQFCRAPIRHRSDVRFVQKISKASCNEGRTWGVRTGGIWVNDGCRARFEVGRESQYSYQGSGYHYGSYNRYPSSGNYYGGDRYNGCDSENKHYPNVGYGSWWNHHFNAFPRPKPGPKPHYLKKRDRCPAGARPGRCTDDQRRRGCKDFRTSSGLGCMTYR